MLFARLHGRLRPRVSCDFFLGVQFNKTWHLMHVVIHCDILCHFFAILRQFVTLSYFLFGCPLTKLVFLYSSDDQFREKKYDSDEEESPNLFCPLCAQKFGYSFGLVIATKKLDRFFHLKNFDFQKQFN